MTLFDEYVAVDWSAKATRAHGANSIWIAVCDSRRTPTLENPATRREAMDRIETLLGEATAEGRRLICGFDFSFGYPEGTARKLTGRDCWEAIWERIAEVIEDGPNNRNNRFDAAAELNGCFGGAGPFWGNGLQRDIPGLLRTRPRCGWGENLPPNRRYTDLLVPGAKEVWKVFTREMSVGRR
jgi:precorrin-8X/cobalt-precorrin-8 methylmutase